MSDLNVTLNTDGMNVIEKNQSPLQVHVQNNSTVITTKLNPTQTSIQANMNTNTPIQAHMTGTGAKGEKGEQGFSAYELWLQQGNVGTIEDFLRGDLYYVHDQIASSKVWIITHNLNKYPSVSIVDSGGNLVLGEITYISPYQLTITFSAEFSGKAYLN